MTGSNDGSRLSIDVPIGERRLATLLFMDLCGSSRLADRLESEQLAEIVARLRAIAREAVSAHGGRIIRVQGDGVLAMFGYPVPGEDDAVRAAEAALDAHARFEGAEFRFLPPDLRPARLHSGLHGGVVLVSSGDVERGTLDLVGDAPNTAARLAALAAPGVILADVHTLEPFSRLFDHGPPVVLSLPGRSRPVTAVHVLRRNSLSRRFEATSARGLTPFVGRTAVLADIAAALAAAIQGRQPQCIAVRGQAGIGKTRLLEQIAGLAVAASFLTLRGHCESELRGQVLQPFAEMALGLPDGSDTADGRRRTKPSTTAVPEALRSELANRPVLMLIDDWQWADDASRHMLESLLRFDGPLVVVLATRNLADDLLSLSGGGTQIPLQPFVESETRHTVQRWLAAADPFTVSEIHRYAGGVPLFIEELCHSVVSRQPLNRSREQIGTSAWLCSLVAVRLSRLGALHQRVVRTAAVLGNMMPYELLRRVGDWDDRDLDLDALAEADFIFASDSKTTLRFKHGLTRDAVYQTVGLAERNAIHGRALAILSSDERWRDDLLEARAYHARSAGLWHEAADHAERAADRASGAFAYDSARGHYVAAMDALERTGKLDGADEPDAQRPDATQGPNRAQQPDRVRVQERAPQPDRATLARWCSLSHKLGMACIFDLLAIPDALPIFERALARARLTNDDELIARSLYWLSYLSYGHGRLRQAVTLAREALVLAGRLADKRLAAQIEATLGQALGAACQYDEALQLMERALAAKRGAARSGSGVAVGSAFTLASKASILADRGDFGQANAVMVEAMDLVGESKHPVAYSVRNWGVMILLWQGRWTEARQVGDESIRLAELSHALLPLTIGRAASGYARWMNEQSEAAVAEIAEALEWIEQRGGRYFTSIYHGWLVEANCMLGRRSLARHHAAKLLLRSRASELLGEACGMRALALAAARDGRQALTRHYLQRADACAAAKQSGRERALNELCRAELHHLRGNRAGATEAARAARAAFSAMQMDWHGQLALRLCR